MQKYKDIPPIKAEIDYLDENVPTSGEIQSVASDKISHSRVC